MKPRPAPRIPPPPPTDGDASTAAGQKKKKTASASPKYRQDNRSRDETDALIAGIRKTIAAAAKTAGRDDCIRTLIAACIAQGFDIAPRIAGIARALGFHAQNVEIVLKRSTGTDPAAHLWYKDEKGRYRLLAA